MTRDSEEWRAIPGFVGFYEVSSEGRIRGVDRIVPIRKASGTFHRRQRGMIIGQTRDRDGYSRVLLRRDGKQKMLPVHPMVATVFCGRGRNALHREVAHLDGDRANPRASNLKWVSHRENHSHRKLHGTDPVGERHPLARLSTADVLAIRSSPLGLDEAASQYGVKPGTISDIRRRKRWPHV